MTIAHAHVYRMKFKKLHKTNHMTDCSWMVRTVQCHHSTQICVLCNIFALYKASSSSSSCC